jgi:nucleoside-triphosphatase THEP1
MNITLITGEKHSGKSTYFYNLYHRLQTDAVALFSKKLMSGDHIEGYDLVILPAGMTKPLVRNAANYQGEGCDVYRQGQFVFFRDTFHQAEEYVRTHASSSDIWIDEVGKLELHRLGFYPLLHYLVTQNCNLTLVVNSKYKIAVIDLFKSMASQCHHELAIDEVSILRDYQK